MLGSDSVMGIWELYIFLGTVELYRPAGYAGAALYIPHSIERNVWVFAVGLVPVVSKVGRSEH